MAGLKDWLLRVATNTGISTEEFDAVSIHTWPGIMHKIEAAFVMHTNLNAHFNWWWERLKKPQQLIYFKTGRARERLHYLVAEHERVWLVACEPFNYEEESPSAGQYWLLEGTAKAVISIIGKYSLREYYLVSKKYDWLICEIKYDELIGLGKAVARIQMLTNQLEEAHSEHQA